MQVTVLAWARNFGNELMVRLPYTGTHDIRLDGCTANARDDQLPAGVAAKVAKNFQAGWQHLPVEVVSSNRNHWLYALSVREPSVADWYKAGDILTNAGGRFHHATIDAVRALQTFVQQSAA